MWSFKIHRNFDEGFKIAKEAFSNAHAPHVFFNPTLIKAWCQTYRQIRNLSPIFITAVADNNIHAFLPMVVWHRNWKNAFVRSLIPVGYSDFDYHDPIFSTQISASQNDSFWAELIPFLKQNVDFDELSIDGISDQSTPNNDNWQQGEICPMLLLNKIPDEESLLMFFKTSLRGDIRRQIRRLSEIGNLSLVEYNSFEEIPHESFNNFLQQHSLRWPNAYKAPHFHENLLRFGLPHKCSHFSILKAGDVEVAWHLGFKDDNKFYYYMPAGNQEFLKFSPVKVHLFFLVANAIKNGIKIYDHLRGEENYKDGWSNDAHHVNNLKIFNTKFQSQLKHNILKIRSLLLPPPILANTYLSTTYAINYDTKNVA